MCDDIVVQDHIVSFLLILYIVFEKLFPPSSESISDSKAILRKICHTRKTIELYSLHSIESLRKHIEDTS